MKNEKEFWQIADKTSVNDFIKLLDYHTLDPITLNYGKYATMVKKSHYHPEHIPDEDQPKINSQFTDLSWHFEGNPTKQEILKAKKEVNKHLKSEKFQKALLDKFNCVSIELTYFIDPSKLKEFGMYNFRGDWYGTIKSDLYFPILNWWGEDFKKEWREMQKKGEDLKNISSFYLSIVFSEKHYTSSEYEELMNFEFPKKRTGNGTIIHQAHRANFSKETLKKCKEYTFNSTGRKILYDPESSYCFGYMEIDPFITVPTRI
jgi:hypothetical protein